MLPYLAVREVEHEHHQLRALVERFANGLIARVASSVPQLQQLTASTFSCRRSDMHTTPASTPHLHSNVVAIDHYFFHGQISPDRGLVVLLKLVVDESADQRSLANRLDQQPNTTTGE